MHLDSHESDQCTICTSTLNFQCAVIYFLMLNQNQCHDFVLLVETNFIAASCLGLPVASDNEFRGVQVLESAPRKQQRRRSECPFCLLSILCLNAVYHLFRDGFFLSFLAVAIKSKFNRFYFV